MRGYTRIHGRDYRLRSPELDKPGDAPVVVISDRFWRKSEFSKAKPRRRELWLLCGLLIAFVVHQVGCGGGSRGQHMQPLDYTVTVSATSGAIQHTTQITVVIP